MSAQSQPVTATADAATPTAQPSAATLPWVCWDRPIRYGDWKIYRNDFTVHPDWLSVAWLYTHDDYDGPEDNRHGFAASIDACIADIQEREEEAA